MSKYESITLTLRASPKTWLITGAAGFIGSNLLETLLLLDQKVIGLDNFATGHRHNLAEVETAVSAAHWSRFTFQEADIRDRSACETACKGVDYVLHQAALGSVPRSLADPVTTNAVNIDGFMNMLVAARSAEVTSFVYAASSSTYGDHPTLPKVEQHIGKPLSPYAVTKYVNELYAEVFARCYQFDSIGLRYFNVFGKRQDPNGAYAAVIPKWVVSMVKDEDVCIYGDGETSRDFCHIENVVQINILAATAGLQGSEVFNVAVNARTSLTELFKLIARKLRGKGINFDKPASYGEFRGGDVRHSQADINKAETILGYRAVNSLESGLEQAIGWYIEKL